MRAQIPLSMLAVLLIVTVSSCSPPVDGKRAAPDVSGAPDPGSLRVAVVTGGHAFDVPNFHRLFRQLPGIDAYPQHLEHFASSPEFQKILRRGIAWSAGE